MFALFKGNKQISKAHSTKEAAIIEAIEAKVVCICSPDFCDDIYTIMMIEGHSIKEVAS